MLLEGGVSDIADELAGAVDGVVLSLAAFLLLRLVFDAFASDAPAPAVD